MRLAPIVIVAVALLASTETRAATPAKLDSTQAVAKARDMREAVSRKDADRLWREFDDRMKSAIGDKEKLVGALEQILGQTGKPLECPTETASKESGLWVVTSRCRFEKSNQPLNVEFSFDEDGLIAGMWFKPDAVPYPTTHESDSTKTVLHLPFRGEWTVFWGGTTLAQNYHVVARDQRFAYDIVRTRAGVSHEGDGTRNQQFYCWLQPIVAPARGTVLEVVDGIPDNTPGAMDNVNRAGNYVVLDHGNGEYSLFAHFHRGSLRVKAGQAVADGDTLGLCGNSGNSSEPHLHYHLQNSPKFGEGDGLPAYFVDYIADDKPVARGIPVRGQVIRRAP